MCCIFFTTETPGHHLILASNRDEFLARPTASAAFHAFPPQTCFVPDGARPGAVLLAPEAQDAQSSSCNERHPILSSIDAHPSGGGTWIGISASSGRWAALTNFTEDAPPPIPAHKAAYLKAYRSRGTLVKEWLRLPDSNAHGHAEDLDRYVAEIARARDEYPGFNLLLGQLPTARHPEPRLAYVTNRDHTGSSSCGSSSTANDQASGARDGLSGEVKFFAPTDSAAQRETPSSAAEEDSLPSGALTREERGGLIAEPHSYGLSNSVLSEPWAKVQSGRAGFDGVVSRYGKAVQARGGDHDDVAPRAKEELVRGLFAVIATPSLDVVTQRTDLRKTVLVPAFNATPKPQTKPAQSPSQLREGQGARPTAPPQASAAAAGAWYGTRTSTVILVERAAAPSSAAKEGVKVTFIERDVYVLPPRPQRGTEEKEEERRPRLLSETERSETERRFEFFL